MAHYTPPKPHYGGQLGLLGLLSMLALTGCMTLADRMPGAMSWLPAMAQPASDHTPVALPVHAVSEADMKAVFIVRFDADPALDPVGKTFRKDAAYARATYQDWAQNRPALKDLKLISASYSGELILGLPKDSPREANTVLQDIQAMSNLAYAERDVMAQTGQKGGPQ
jgi:hypothetical protein